MAGTLLKAQRDPLVVIRAIADSLSLTMFDVGRLIVPSTKVPVAAWGYDPDANRERIWLNWEKLSTLPDDELIWLIKHETLHRAGYQEGYEFQDEKLGLLALDVVINKILHLADAELSVRAARHVYPDEVNGTALALARPDLQRDQVPERYRPVWDEVWGDDRIPSVYPIYFALQLDEKNVKKVARRVWAGDANADEEQQDQPFEDEKAASSDKPPDGPPPPLQPSMFEADAEGELRPKESLLKPPPSRRRASEEGAPRLRGLPENPLDSEVLDRAAADARNLSREIQARGIVGDGFSKTFSRFFSKLGLTKEKTHTEEIEDFLAQIRGKDEADEAISRLMAALGLEPRVEAVPGDLTPTGVFMAAAGVSGRIGVWWNQVPLERRPKMRIYVDTSPSMADWATRTVYIIDTLKDELPSRMYAFAGDVRECETADFARGEYYRGSSTYFDRVVEDLCANDEELALIITDGESTVSTENRARARRSGKMIFTILCGSKGDSEYNGRALREISVATMSLFEKPRARR